MPLCSLDSLTMVVTSQRTHALHTRIFFKALWWLFFFHPKRDKMTIIHCKCSGDLNINRILVCSQRPAENKSRWRENPTEPKCCVFIATDWQPVQGLFIHAFISLCQVFGIGLFPCSSQSTMTCLQLEWDNAARLLTNTSAARHQPSAFYWFTVKYRLHFHFFKSHLWQPGWELGATLIALLSS